MLIRLQQNITKHYKILQKCSEVSRWESTVGLCGTSLRCRHWAALCRSPGAMENMEKCCLLGDFVRRHSTSGRPCMNFALLACRQYLSLARCCLCMSLPSSFSAADAWLPSNSFPSTFGGSLTWGHQHPPASSPCCHGRRIRQCF